MQKNRIFQLFSAIFCITILTSPLFAIEQIAVVVVIDQFAHHMLSHVKPYFKGGIKLMLDNGISFENAHYPYAGTATGPGHTCLNTGALPKDNGIVKNSWFNREDKKITCDEGSAQEAAVFTQKNTVYPFGKSAAQLKVNGISDQLIANKSDSHNAVYSFSLKPRAAVCTAGTLGKAFWLDDKTACLTTGKAYFSQPPSWLNEFNKNHVLHSKTFSWNLTYPRTSKAYNFLNDSYYPFSRCPGMIHRLADYTFYFKLPESNNYLLEASKACLLDAQEKNPKKVLLWLCLSSLDPVGHAYGPHSIEYVDTLYHIDNYLQTFIDWIHRTFPQAPTLFVLTADHGSAPIPELLHKQGFTLARRINQKELHQNINQYISSNHGVENIVSHIDTPSLFLDKKKLATLEPSLKNKILNDIKQYLKKIPGIKNAWTFHELEHCSTQEHDIRNYFKNSLFAGRSGEIQFQIDPYCFVSKHEKGTGHSSPYDYTTHVPLVIYQQEKTKKTCVTEPVVMMQVAPTLAQFFSVSPPSASSVPPLPHVYHID